MWSMCWYYPGSKANVTDDSSIIVATCLPTIKWERLTGGVSGDIWKWDRRDLPTRRPGLDLGQSTFSFWWTAWDWDRFSSRNFGLLFLISIILPMLHSHISFINERHYMILYYMMRYDVIWYI